MVLIDTDTNKTRTSKVGAIYKAQKVFNIYSRRIYEKHRKQIRDTQKVPFKLDKTRRPLFPQVVTKYFF